MKTPIAYRDILPGDLVRAEWDSASVNKTAVEYRMQANRGNGYSAADRHFLLERPAPPVELPTEPTLGWLTYAGDTIFGEFRKFQAADSSFTTDMTWQASEIRDGETHNSYANVTAFTPATAVPRGALNELRNAEARAMEVRPFDAYEKNEIRCQAINTFLDSIDEANR